MQIKSKVFLAFLLLCIQGCTPGCGQSPIKQVSEITFSCKKPISFVFINGMLNKEEDAEDSTKNLSDSTGVEFNLLYNVSISISDDLIQSYKQKRNQKDINLLEFILKFIDKTLRLSESELRDIYTLKEKSQIDYFVKETEEKKLFIVAHSQGNLFAKDICNKATIQPDLHGFATPISNKPKCEKNHYTFEQDFIGLVGRSGNYRYSKKIEIKEAIRKTLDALSDPKELFNVFIGLHYHEFQTYLDETQKPINDLKNRIPKDDSRKPIIESLKVIGPQGAEPIILNGKQYPDGISCKDITSNFLNVVTPTLDPFYPDQIFGFKYAVKMKGAEWVYLKNKANNSSHYALTISKAETDPSSATDKYVIKDAGFASLFGAEPPKPQPRSIASPLPPAKPSTIASPQMPRGEVSPTTQRSQPPLEMVRP